MGVHTCWPSMWEAVIVSWVLREPGLIARHWQREIAERGGEEGGEDKESKPKKEEEREEGQVENRFIKFSRPTWIYDPPDSASWLTEFIGMCHYSWLLWWFFKIYFLDLIFCISSYSPFLLPSFLPFLFFLSLFLIRVSFSLGWPWTHYLAKDDLELEPTPSTSQA